VIGASIAALRPRRIAVSLLYVLATLIVLLAVAP